MTEEKRWKQVARTLGRDLSKQTSASHSMRTNYHRTLLDFENWLFQNSHTLGPRPEAGPAFHCPPRHRHVF